MGGETADVCVVFAAAMASEGAHGVLHAVRRATGARGVVGCSGAGVLTEQGEWEETELKAVRLIGLASGRVQA